MKKAVQQLMLGKVIRNEEQTADVLEKIAFAGYDGVELNGYMIRKTSVFVRALTAAAGMPAGRGGAFDWAALTRGAHLSVMGLHEDLGTLKKDPDAVIRTAKSLGTNRIILTGLYRFDYSDPAAMRDLCRDLNRLGTLLSLDRIELLYHNHNVELCRLRDSGERAYAYLVRNTDPTALNFEFDSYWFADGGADVAAWMERLGSRMRCWHINDRGARLKRTPLTPIVREDSTELGYGNLPLERWAGIAKANGTDTVVLETHRNHIDGDPLKSLQRSAAFLNRTF
ncbi:MAG: TIM barrel protein [Clostridia bacterium]|nr:TIM barrel protein [Clostridia bacterium]